MKKLSLRKYDSFKNIQPKKLRCRKFYEILSNKITFTNSKIKFSLFNNKNAIVSGNEGLRKEQFWFIIWALGWKEKKYKKFKYFLYLYTEEFKCPDFIERQSPIKNWSKKIEFIWYINSKAYFWDKAFHSIWRKIWWWWKIEIKFSRQFWRARNYYS